MDTFSSQGEAVLGTGCLEEPCLNIPIAQDQDLNLPTGSRLEVRETQGGGRSSQASGLQGQPVKDTPGQCCRNIQIGATAPSRKEV